MKKLFLFWVFVCAFLIPLSAGNDTVMVFGTSRGELNDTEDRILREEIMRRIAEKGLTVVSVYDVENILRESWQDIRSASMSDRKVLAEKAAARILVYGVFRRSAGSLSLMLSVSDSSGKALGEKEIALDLKQPVRSQWQMIAETVSAAVKSICSPSSVK